ncbi:MAG: ABC transporter permease [Fibromonadaceae bacterium]|jgi:peptide/nickel transport system permease protein|nr:ABC transporter permease [Fibromonadaceae bacterium]
MLKKFPTARYVLLRALWYFLTFLIAIALNFFLPRLGSDPVDIMMAQSSFSSPEIRKQTEENLRKNFGLIVVDKQGNIERDENGNTIKASKFSQLITYISHVFMGDLGTSFKNNKKVSEIILQALPWTIALQLPTIILGWICGNLLGALAAYRRGVFDKVIFPMALLMSSIPFFVFGMVLVYFFGIVWDFFPAVGAYSLELTPSFSLGFLLSAAFHYVLPFFSIFLILAGGQAIGMRSMGIYELGTDYIKYAKWLGLKETRVLIYLFRNAMLPQLTGLALSIGGMVGGALITEMIFSYPGLGMAMLTAIQTNDYPVIQGVTLLITTSVLLANFTVDILIALLDPRVKASLAMDSK